MGKMGRLLLLSVRLPTARGPLVPGQMDTGCELLNVKRPPNLSLIAIVGEGLLSRLSFGLISFSLPLYARHLGLSIEEVGILAALNSAVAVGSKPLLGWTADRFGLKRTYLAAISLRSLVSLSLGFASVPWELF